MGGKLTLESAITISLLGLHLPVYKPERLLLPISIYSSTRMKNKQVGPTMCPGKYPRLRGEEVSVGQGHKVKFDAHCQTDVNEQITAAARDECCRGWREQDRYLDTLITQVSNTLECGWGNGTDNDEDNVG